MFLGGLGTVGYKIYKWTEVKSRDASVVEALRTQATLAMVFVNYMQVLGLIANFPGFSLPPIFNFVGTFASLFQLGTIDLIRGGFLI